MATVSTVDVWRTYVRYLKLPGTDTKHVTEVAYPRIGADHVINVICGPNNSGKSHVLRSLHNLLKYFPDHKDTHEHAGLRVTLTRPGPRPKSVPLGKSWRHKERIGNVSAQQTTELPKDRPDYRVAALHFLLNQLQGHVLSIHATSIEEWISKPNLRTIVLRELEIESKLYLCNQTDPLVILLQDILKATLYFRQASEGKIEFALLNNARTMVPYPKWSDGQQAIFYLLLSLEFEKPDVLLVDELENHMHPMYMTKALEIIKNRVAQTFIATHHPHLIFSELIDRVFYIDALEAGRLEMPPDQLSYTKIEMQGPPKRIVTSLEDSFDKVTASYRLFDQQDHQLLKQANRIQATADILFYEAVAKIFAVEPLEAANRPIPDRQTRDLAEAVKSQAEIQADDRPLRILDLGAGVGRLVDETSKLTIWQLGSECQWVCWEPIKKQRDGLIEKFRTRRIDVSVPASAAEIEDKSCNLAVIANVLHEVKPEVFVDYIVTAAAKLRDTGVILIMELYPLLAAEKYAVAYPATHVKKILNDSGFLCRDAGFPVKDVTGYCLSAHLRPSFVIDRDFVLKTVVATWEDLEREAAYSYASRKGVHNYSDYRAVLQELTTLASIQAWRCGSWR